MTARLPVAVCARHSPIAGAQGDARSLEMIDMAGPEPPCRLRPAAVTIVLTVNQARQHKNNTGPCSQAYNTCTIRTKRHSPAHVGTTAKIARQPSYQTGCARAGPTAHPRVLFIKRERLSEKRKVGVVVADGYDPVGNSGRPITSRRSATTRPSARSSAVLELSRLFGGRLITHRDEHVIAEHGQQFLGPRPLDAMPHHQRPDPTEAVALYGSARLVTILHV